MSVKARCQSKQDVSQSKMTEYNSEGLPNQSQLGPLKKLESSPESKDIRAFFCPSEKGSTIGSTLGSTLAGELNVFIFFR